MTRIRRCGGADRVMSAAALKIESLQRDNEALKRELDMAKEENHILWDTVNNGTRLRTGEILPPSTMTVFGMTLRQIADMKGDLEHETGRAAANWKAAETLSEANELLRRELQEARDEAYAKLLEARGVEIQLIADLAAARAKLEECERQVEYWKQHSKANWDAARAMTDIALAQDNEP